MAGPNGGTVVDEVLDVELPADLMPALPAEAEAAPVVTAETETAAEPVAVKPAEAAEPVLEAAPVETGETVQPATRRREPGSVPTAELLKERRKRQDAEAQLRAVDEVAASRARLDEARRREAEQRQQAAPEPMPDYDGPAFPDLKTIGKTIEGRVQREIKRVEDDAQAKIIATRVTFSQNLMRALHTDYDETLAKAGVTAATAIDRATSKPMHPERFDRALWEYVYLNEDPARAAYDYAKGILSKQTETEAEVRGEARGRASVVDKVFNAGNRSRGISALPASSASVQRGISRATIAAMSDDQQRRLKSERPEVWNWYKDGPAA